MKRIISVLLFAALAFTSSFAQEMPKPGYPDNPNEKYNFRLPDRPFFNEISLGYGALSMTRWMTQSGKWLLTETERLMDLDVQNVKTTGVFSLEYMRYVPSGRFAYGGVVGVENITSTVVYEDNDLQPSTRSCCFLSIMPTAKVVWFNRSHFGMYTSLAAGLLWAPKNKVTNFAFQFNLIGAEFGGEHIRGFAQASIGFLGVAQVGVRANF